MGHEGNHTLQPGLQLQPNEEKPRTQIVINFQKYELSSNYVLTVMLTYEWNIVGPYMDLYETWAIRHKVLQSKQDQVF